MSVAWREPWMTRGESLSGLARPSRLPRYADARQREVTGVRDYQMVIAFAIEMTARQGPPRAA